MVWVWWVEDEYEGEDEEDEEEKEKEEGEEEKEMGGAWNAGGRSHADPMQIPCRYTIGFSARQWHQRHSHCCCTSLVCATHSRPCTAQKYPLARV